MGLPRLHRQGRRLFFAASYISTRLDGVQGDSPFVDAGDAIKSINCNATNALAVAHYEAKDDEATAAALACLESRCGLDAKTVDEAYKDFDKKEPWDEVLS